MRARWSMLRSGNVPTATTTTLSEAHVATKIVRQSTNNMIIDCISDLHGFLPQLEGGDLLIIAGDLTARDQPIEYDQFARWLDRQKYKCKIVIAGNHDGLLQRFPCRVRWDYKQGRAMGRLYSATYLLDSAEEFEGLKIWGSPWTPTFLNWHFMKDRGEQIKAIWDLIPNDIDILVTHGPPHGILDRNINGEHCGCEELRETSFRIAPKLHVFGHIHEQGGKTINTTLTTFVNASIMNERYNPVNKPIRVIL